MLRSVAIACSLGVALGFAPEGCAKLGRRTPTGNAAPTETAPAPPTSAPAPPIWTPPEQPPAATTPYEPPPNIELVLAQEAARKREYKKARAILEKKQKSQALDAAELELLITTCIATKDRKCIDALVGAHPELSGFVPQ